MYRPYRPHSIYSVTVLLNVLMLAALPAAASLIIVGTPADQGNGNCYPFGCNYSTVGPEYQQVYSHTQFNGPLLVTKLEFFNTQANNFAIGMNTGNFDIHLSAT